MADRREVDRFEWRIGDIGDPAQLLQDFLVSHGIPADDLAAMSVYNGSQRCDARLPMAALLVSAAGATAMIGQPSGPPSPAPDVPDVVAICYEDPHPLVRPAPGDLAGAGLSMGEWRPSWTTEAHLAAVQTVRSAIAAGEVYQANVVAHQRAAFSGDVELAFRAVNSLPGARYQNVLCGKGWGVASASPECLLTIEGNTVTSRPIKGTRPRTAAGRKDLLQSAKERAEHIMIVDLVRNDVAHLATTGTVEVTDLFAAQPWCDLWQAESTITAELRAGVDLATTLRAVAPAGSVTGAPKLAAIDLIQQIEPVGRGPSMGAIGWITPARLDLGVTIRTVAAAAGELHLWTGGGITWSSDPEAEVAEAEAKATPIRLALERATDQAVHIM